MNHYWPFILSCTNRSPATPGDRGPGLRWGERNHVVAADEDVATGDVPTPDGSGPRVPEWRAAPVPAVASGRT